MADSLQDQLLKAGLVDKNKVNKVTKDKQRKAKQQRHSRSKAQQNADQRSRAAPLKDVERDRELNRIKNQQAQRNALAAQIRQLIENNRVASSDGEIAYHFNDAGKIRRIFVDATMHRQLSLGKLAIVRWDDRYELVPTVVADKIGQRDTGCVIVRNDAVSERNPDDPYAEYEVPDDLVW